MGDKSGSMDIAIRISTIIASLLTAITSAKLVFFNTVNKVADFIPKNIEEVHLDFAFSVHLFKHGQNSELRNSLFNSIEYNFIV